MKKLQKRAVEIFLKENKNNSASLRNLADELLTAVTEHQVPAVVYFGQNCPAGEIKTYFLCRAGELTVDVLREVIKNGERRKPTKAEQRLIEIALKLEKEFATCNLDLDIGAEAKQWKDGFEFPNNRLLQELNRYLGWRRGAEKNNINPSARVINNLERALNAAKLTRK